MSCPEPDSYIRDNIKILLDLINYANKKWSEHAAGADHLIYHKSEFVALKADVNKLDIKWSDAVDKEVYKKAI